MQLNLNQRSNPNVCLYHAALFVTETQLVRSPHSSEMYTLLRMFATRLGLSWAIQHINVFMIIHINVREWMFDAA